MKIAGRRERVGAVFWGLCVQFFVAEQVARAAWRVPYNMRSNVISDLGMVACSGLGCSPLRAVMNGSFVLQGMLIAGGAICLRRLFEGQLGGIATWLFVMSGTGVLVVGLVPEDVMHGLHTLGATVHFVCGGVAMVAVGFGWLRGGRKAGAWVGIGCGITALLATALLGFHDSGVVNAVGIGLVERVAAYPLPLWLAGMGLWLLSRRAEAISI